MVDIVSGIKRTRSEIAILLGAGIIGLSILGAACWLKPGFTPNPAGGIWVQRNDTIYLCRMNTDKPAACMRATDGKVVTYSSLPK
jgi:hypothetical protein